MTLAIYAFRAIGALSLVLTVFVVGGCDGRRDPERIISDCSDGIFRDIQASDGRSYVARLGPQRGDRAVNWHTGREIPELIPYAEMEEAELAKERARLEDGFAKTVKQLKDSAGDLAKIEFISLHYLINDSGWERKTGILKFSIILELKGSDRRTVFVSQSGCGLTQSGVRVGDPIRILKSLPEYYK